MTPLDRDTAVDPAHSSLGERRYLSVLFADLCDSTLLGASLEAEHYAALLGRLRDLYQSVIRRHGGTVVRMQGDGLLAMFGHPQPREDDGRRATQAALELHAQVRFLLPKASLPQALPLALHSGVHGGLVLLEEGDAMRGRFELFGNVPNLAARLSALAERDQVLVSEDMLGPWRHHFATGERRMVEIRGMDSPLAVYQVHGLAAGGTGVAVRARRGVVPFVGRRDECAQLEAALWQALAKRRPVLATIVAAPGMGKTRLADELLVRAAGHDCRLLRGYCEDSLGAEPLQPFVQMLRAACELEAGLGPAAAAQALDRHLAGLRGDLGPWKADLLALLSPPAEASRVPCERQGDALCAWIDALAAEGPLAVFIDDWEWADAATVQVLAGLCRLPGRPVFVLLAQRPVEPRDAGEPPALRLELPPLTDAESAEVIAGLLPRGDPFVAAEVTRAAGGNPLYLEELCHGAAHGGRDRRPGRDGRGPAWLEMLIESRVSRLPRAQADLVRAAAVIGNVVPLWLLERLTGWDSSHAVVRALAEADFLFPGEQPGTLRFKHGITRDVIYGAIGLHARRAMHRHIAQALRERHAGGGEDVAEALACHHSAAGDAAEAAAWAEIAGDKAAAACVLDRAQAQYLAALAALDQLEPDDANYRRWVSIAERLGRVSALDPSPQVLEVLRRAVEHTAARRDDAAHARAAFWLAYLSYALGETRTAIVHGEAAVAAAQRVGDESLTRQARAALGQARAAVADYGRALGLLDEAIASSRPGAGPRPAVAVAYTLACRAAVLGDQGHFEAAEQQFLEALHLLRDVRHLVHASVQCWRAAVLLWRGRWQQALKAAEAADDTARRMRSLYVTSMARSLSACAAWRLAPDDGPLQALADTTHWLDRRGQRLGLSLNHGWRAEMLVEAGQAAEARRAAAAALRRARAGDRLGEAAAWRALARAQARAHPGGGGAVADDGRVQRCLAQARAAGARRGAPHEAAVTLSLEAALAAEAGLRDRARHALDEAMTGFEAMGMGWHLEQALALAARL